jgi:hypothetical protein
MKKEGILVDQHWVWSDGAASQLKACRPFYYVSRYFKTFGARMKWFFHASGYGQGVAVSESDAHSIHDCHAYSCPEFQPWEVLFFICQLLTIDLV